MTTHAALGEAPPAEPLGHAREPLRLSRDRRAHVLSGSHGAVTLASRRVDGYRLVHAQEVQFRDIDGLGHVNNAVYLNYLESAKIDYFREVVGDVDLDAARHRRAT